MPRRRRGGVVRTVGRTAVVAGTASAVAGGVSRRQSNRQTAGQQQAGAAEQTAAEQRQADAPVAQAPPTAPQPAAGDDAIARLQQLGDMKTQGLLSDEEFAAAKAKLLGL